MTRLEKSSDSTLLKDLLHLVGEHGTDAISQAFATLVNAAMLVEREATRDRVVRVCEGPSDEAGGVPRHASGGEGG